MARGGGRVSSIKLKDGWDKLPAPIVAAINWDGVTTPSITWDDTTYEPVTFDWKAKHDCLSCMCPQEGGETTT